MSDVLHKVRGNCDHVVIPYKSHMFLTILIFINVRDCSTLKFLHFCPARKAPKSSLTQIVINSEMMSLENDCARNNL